jgi:PAS domain S-box-containing protein
MHDQGAPSDSQNVVPGVMQKFFSGALIESLPVGVCCCDRDGMILRYNRQAVNLWGRTPELGQGEQRFCGAHRLFLMDGQPMPFDATPMAEVLRTKQPARDKEIVIERPDGTRLIVLVNVEPVVGDDGTLQGAVNCFQDVSGLKRAHARAEAQERELHALLEALPAAIYRTDAEGRIIFYNRAAVELSGHKPRIGTDKWCVSWRLHWPDGKPLPHDQCPMATAIREQRPLRSAEIVVERPDGRKVPCIACPTPLFGEDGNLSGAVNMLVDISDRKQAEEIQLLLLRELDHRVKNSLATVQAIASQTLRSAQDPSEFVSGFSGRLQALARAHTTITHNNWRGAEITDVLHDQLLLEDDDDARIVLSGPALMLDAQPALHLALVLHELGTNARKHGALSGADGHVSVTWAVHANGSSDLLLHWKETGGPRVTAPSRYGFGTSLISKSLSGYGGEVSMVYEADGLRCDIQLSLSENAPSRLDRALRKGALASLDDEKPAHPKLFGLRVLVVEDEPLIALDIDEILQETRCKVIGPATTVEGAMRCIEANEIDAALLDANLSGSPVDDLAAALTRSNIPFAFVTGYGRDGLPASFREAMVIAKPFDPETILSALARLVEPAGAISLRGQHSA